MVPNDDIKAKIAEANQKALQRIFDSQPVWVGMERAIAVIPGMTKSTILHAGPPIPYENMCVPQQVAVRGALIYEDLAKGMDEADELARSSDITIAPCHEHRAVGSGCGIISASMPVYVVRNEAFGNDAFCTIHESLRRCRMVAGCWDKGVLRQLRWLENVMGPALDYAVKKLGGVSTKPIISRALAMGDELHNRHWAATGTLALELMPVWLDGGFEREKAEEAARYLARAEQFFLHLAMATCKATADAADGIDYSTVVTAMARNGVELGIRVSGLPGQWFTGPAGMIEGLYFSGFSIEDSCPDLGDSAIAETMGLGAFAMAAAPALELGATLETAINTTREMDEITVGNNSHYPIPVLHNMGTPTGIDIRLVLDTGITPTINTGIAHKDGFGAIGLGTTKAPLKAFQEALKAFRNRYLS